MLKRVLVATIVMLAGIGAYLILGEAPEDVESQRRVAGAVSDNDDQPPATPSMGEQHSNAGSPGHPSGQSAEGDPQAARARTGGSASDAERRRTALDGSRAGDPLRSRSDADGEPGELDPDDLGARSAAQAGLVGPNEPRSIDFDGDGHTSAREIGEANRIERRSKHHAAQYDLADNEFPIAAEDYTGWMPQFDASDENGDGLMDINEFEGFYYDTLFEWNRLDTNGDNAISAAEFDGSAELFNEFDHIPNGLLDKAEFRRGRAILLQRAAQGG